MEKMESNLIRQIQAKNIDAGKNNDADKKSDGDKSNDADKSLNKRVESLEKKVLDHTVELSALNKLNMLKLEKLITEMNGIKDELKTLKSMQVEKH